MIIADLAKGLSAQEIRVLQELRRVGGDTMSLAAIKAIRHPVGGGEAPALRLVERRYLAADAARENFTLTPEGKEFLAYDPKPEVEGAGGEDAPAD
jgi:hypothetical protein